MPGFSKSLTSWTIMWSFTQVVMSLRTSSFWQPSIFMLWTCGTLLNANSINKLKCLLKKAYEWVPKWRWKGRKTLAITTKSLDLRMLRLLALSVHCYHVNMMFSTNNFETCNLRNEVNNLPCCRYHRFNLRSRMFKISTDLIIILIDIKECIRPFYIS